MSDTTFASLSPSLLARKGGAKPAMRPQNTAGVVDARVAAASLEDLGWNDMGDEVVATFNPVRATIERIAAKLESAPAAPAGPAPAARLARDNRRAAFTLRLDQERHLKLRLACTLRGRSAQQIVTDALDAMLKQMPEIDNLAAQVLRD